MLISDQAGQFVDIQSSSNTSGQAGLRVPHRRNPGTGASDRPDGRVFGNPRPARGILGRSSMKSRLDIVPSAFSLKVGMIIVLILAFAVSAVGGLGYLKFGKTFDELIIARLKATTTELIVPVESSLTLGLRLEELSTLPELIRNEAASDPNILNLEVADEDGKVLFASQPDEVGKPIGALPVDLAADRKGEAITAVLEKQELLLLAPLRNSFDKIVGSVVLHYSLAARNQARHMVLTHIAEGLAVLLAIALVAAPIVAQLLFAGFQARLRASLHAVNGAFDPSLPGDEDSIAARIAAFAKAPIPEAPEGDEFARDTATILRALQRGATPAAETQGPIASMAMPSGEGA